MLILLVLRAALTFDPYFDTTWYHLPFAARVSGICPESCFLMDPRIEAAYDGFPKLFHFLQGLVWRLTGSAQTVDLVNVGALVIFSLFLRSWFKVPIAWALCGLLAVPLVQIQVTSTYVDLPANLAAAAGILALMEFVRDPPRFGWRGLLVLLGCLAVAANGKPQMIAMAVPVWTVFGVAAFANLAAGQSVGPFAPDRIGDWLGLVLLLAIAGALTAAQPIANWMNHGNPFYPVRLTVFGVLFDGPVEGDTISSDSLSDEWRSVPAPLRWVASVLEFGAYAYRALPWTYDQGYCFDTLDVGNCGTSEGQDRLAGGMPFRMGGYFVTYVLSLLAFLMMSIADTRGRTRISLWATFFGTTLLAALLPRSHELRYYLFWMIVLVSLCLISTFRHTDASVADHTGDLAAKHATNNSTPVLGTILLIALLSVVSMSRAHFINPLARGIDEVIDKLDIRDRVSQIPDGTIVCVGQVGRPPFNFLYASIFHPGRAYSLRDRENAGDCIAQLPGPSS